MVTNCSDISRDLLQYAYATAYVIGTFLQNAAAFPFAVQSTAAAGACAPSSLFPVIASYEQKNTSVEVGSKTPDILKIVGKFEPNRPIMECLTAICSPSTVDQDLAGIGVCQL